MKVLKRESESYTKLEMLEQIKPSNVHLGDNSFQDDDTDNLGSGLHPGPLESGSGRWSKLSTKVIDTLIAVLLPVPSEYEPGVESLGKMSTGK